MGSNTISQERRKFDRVTLELDAKIETPTGEPIPVVIRNHSIGGLFLQVNEHYSDINGSHFNVADRIIVTLKLPRQSESSRYLGKIAHQSESGLGVSFQQTQPELHKALQDAFSTPSEPDLTNESLAGHTSPELCEAVETLAREWTFKRFAVYLSNAEETLLNHADLAKSANDQNQFFASMGFLRRHKASIDTAFKQTFREHLQHYHPVESDHRNQETDSHDNEELSLVDEQEFEVWLAQSEIISSIESKAYAGLRALETRLSAIRDQHVDASNSPLGPLVMSHCVLTALRQHPFPLPSLLILIREFGRSVLNQLPELIEKANEMLIQADVLPKLHKVKRKVKQQQTGKAAAVPQQSAQPAQAEQQPVADSIPLQEQPAPATPAQWSQPDSQSPAASIIELQKYLSPGPAPGSETAASPSEEDSLTMEMLNQALTELSNRIKTPLENMQLSDQIQDFFQQGDMSDSGQLSGPQADAVFVTDQLFDAILGDEVVNESAKNWISELEIPLLRSLLKDDSVLTQTTHPARRLIDMLGNAEVEQDQESRLSENIKKVLNELKDITNPTEQDFQGALEKIEKLLKRQDRQRSTLQKRVVDASEGQYRLQQAEQSVQQQLDQRLDGQNVPDVIVDLLDAGWRQLMTLAAVQTGDQSPAFKEKMATIDQLMDMHQEGRAIDKDETAGLIARIESDLDPASPSPAKISAIREKIQSLASGEEVETNSWEAQQTDSQADTEEWPDPDNAERFTEEQMDNAFWIGQTKLIEIGQWLLERESTGQLRPIKLAWISDDRQRYTFVDRNGQKAIELSADQLATRLKDKEADVVDQSNEPLVDRSHKNMLQRMHDQIAHQATHDELTGTLNRKEFERILRQKMGESKLVHSSHGVMLLDLDQFRVINSSAGHDAGDQLLIELSDTIQKELPERASLARLGADQFTVIVPRCGAPEAHELAERIRTSISSHRTEWKNRKLRATASIGLVLMDQDTTSVSQVLNQLDSACASAKESGDRIRSYELDDAELTRRDQALELVAELEKALDSERLILYAQKIQPLHPDNQEVRHYEVLCRIKQLDGSLVPPNQFVPAAEAHGRVHFLDEAVFRTAFRMLHNSKAYNSNLRLSLNLSGKTFSRPNFLTYIKDLLKEFEIKPSQICFEITETAAIANLSRCADVLKELRYLGCQFSLDDFGTGLSSFGYLKNLPVDYLKIDGSFVRDIVNSQADRGLVKTMNEIGQMLGKKTIAESVESPQALTCIKELGLDYAQGFEISKPQPLTDILQPR